VARPPGSLGPGGKHPWGHALSVISAALVVLVASPGPSRQHGGLGRSTEDGYYNGKQVDQGIARKAQQEPEGEMEGTETAAAAEATQSVSIIGFVSQRTCIRI
jgi:hypothetical protein